MGKWTAMTPRNALSSSRIINYFLFEQEAGKVWNAEFGIRNGGQLTGGSRGDGGNGGETMKAER
jgi:hypothetical protein